MSRQTPPPSGNSVHTRKSRRALFLVAVGIASLFFFCRAESMAQAGRPRAALELKAEAFPPGGDIPPKFTCDGTDVSPALSWNEPPRGTESLALIADDPDAPAGTWVHWVAYDLPPETRQLRENVPRSEQLPGGGRQGRNDFGRLGYGGPCPPPGKAHRYFFKLYALDAKLHLPAGAAKRDVEQAMQGHILAQGQVMGRYRR